MGSNLEYNFRYSFGKIKVGGGFVMFGGGFAKRGVRTNPPNPLVTGLHYSQICANMSYGIAQRKG